MHLSRSEVSEVVFGAGGYRNRNSPKIVTRPDQLTYLTEIHCKWTKYYQSKLADVSTVDQLEKLQLQTSNGHAIAGGLGGLHSMDIAAAVYKNTTELSLL